MENLITLQKGKLPPQAIDIENAIIGGMLIDRKSVDTVMEILHSEVFYKDANKIIFNAIKTLYLNSQGIDLLTVSAQLKKDGKLGEAGGDFALIQLTQKVASTAHIEYHSRILLQKYIQRECITLSSKMIEKSFDETVDSLELLDEFNSGLNSISDSASLDDVQTNFKDDVMLYFDTLEQVNGLPSSLALLRQEGLSYVDSDLIYLAGRPGSGKTALMLIEAYHQANNKTPILIFSLEMSKFQLINRLRSIVSGVELEKIKTKKLTSDELERVKIASEHIAKLPIIIDDRPSLSPLQVKIKAKKMYREKGIKMVFIDYLGLMRIKDRKLSTIDQVTEISASLKGLAKELNIPVMALAQLSREVEKRTIKRPLLSDLRDSGSLEQDANIVMFLYRPEYYKIEQWDDEYKSSTANEAEIDIAKNRDGAVFQARVATDLSVMRFYDLHLKYQDITYKYFDNKEVETTAKKEYILPTANPNEAFLIDDEDIGF